MADFFAATGLDPEEIRHRAGDAAFLGGVLDYLLQDDRLILAFAAAEGIDPAWPARARMKLPGATPDDQF